MSDTCHFVFQARGQSDVPMTVAVEVNKSLVDTIQFLHDNSAFENPVRIRLKAKRDVDDRLFQLLEEEDRAGILEVMNENGGSHCDVDLVIEPDPCDVRPTLYFELTEAAGLRSRKCSLSLFLYAFENPIPSPEELGGLIIKEESEDTFETFEMHIVRVSTSKAKMLSVKARNLEEAERMALAKAGDYEYSESEAHYEIS